MKGDNFSQLNDYDVLVCERQHRHGLVISLCSNSNNLISFPPPPRTASNFRHLLNCGTIVSQVTKNSEQLFTLTLGSYSPGLTAGEIRPYFRDGIRSTNKHLL